MWDDSPLPETEAAALDAAEALVHQLALGRLRPGTPVAEVTEVLGPTADGDLDPEYGGELVFSRKIGARGRLDFCVSAPSATAPLRTVLVDVELRGADEGRWKARAAAIVEALIGTLGAPREDYRSAPRGGVRWEDGDAFITFEAHWSKTTCTFELAGIPRPAHSPFRVIVGFDGLERFVCDGLGNGAGPFTFLGARAGLTLEALHALLGEPAHADLAEAAQRKLTWEAEIDHLEHGRRPHHRATLTAVSYHDAPTRSLRLRIEYFAFGPELAPRWQALVAAIRAHVRRGVGPPTTTGKHEHTWARAGERLWLSDEGGVLVLELSTTSG